MSSTHTHGGTAALMRGLGSGNFGARHQTTDAAFRLDLARVQRAGLVNPPSIRQRAWGSDLGPRSLAAIDVTAIPLGWDAEGPAVVLDYRRADETVSTRVPLAATRTHYGGERWWFLCPTCRRRARVLHLAPGRARFACRRCCRLRYRAQRLTMTTRWQRRAEKTWARLGGESFIDGVVHKPKGMHWRTFHRLMDEADEYWGGAMGLDLARFFARCRSNAISPELRAESRALLGLGP